MVFIVGLLAPLSSVRVVPALEASIYTWLSIPPSEKTRFPIVLLVLHVTVLVALILAVKFAVKVAPSAITLPDQFPAVLQFELPFKIHVPLGIVTPKYNYQIKFIKLNITKS
jgi:hypothetical protein